MGEHLRFDPEEGFAPPSLGIGPNDAKLRATLPRAKWNAIADDVRVEFNRRLKKEGLPAGRWKTGGNPLARLLGKELTLLAWAIEDADPTLVPAAVRKLARSRAGGAVVAVHDDRRRDGACVARPGPGLAQGGALRAHREPGRCHGRPSRGPLRHLPADGAGGASRAHAHPSSSDRRPARRRRRREGRPLSIGVSGDAGSPAVASNERRAPGAGASFIETQFPVSRLSKESYKERKANYSQTLTGLGKWWGRKPLVMVRAVILGLLMPASSDPRKDREVFLALLTMDDDGLRRRKRRTIPLKELWRHLLADERSEWFGAGADPDRPRLKKSRYPGPGAVAAPRVRPHDLR